MPPAPPTYMIFHDVSGVYATYDEFVRRLKRFSRSALLRVCSVLNLVLTQWTEGYDEKAHARLVHTFFPESLAVQMLDTGRPVFHRHQLLYIAQEALRHCEDTQEPVTGSDLRGTGELMLMASELLVPIQQIAATTSVELARRICSILPDMETNGPLSYHRKMARSLAMCTRIVDQLRGTKNFVDIRRLFGDATGIELETFYALLFGCFSRFLDLKQIKSSLELSDYGVSGSFFRMCTAITSDELDRFFQYISADSALYAAEVRQKNPYRNDFTVLRNRPLFADKGLYRPLDVSLLADKMETGVFWSVNGQLDSARRTSFHQFWGEVFELYATWVIGSSVDGNVNKFYPDPRYQGPQRKQVCDGIVVSGRSAILIECKGSTFTANGKYGGDPAVLDAELKKKLVGTPSEPKGVRQLANAVQNLYSKDSLEAIDGVDMREIDNIFPVVLTRDDIGSAYNSSAYLNFHFQELMKSIDAACLVMPLCCLSADDIERLTPYLTDVSLGEVLSARIAADHGLVFPLWYGDNKVLGALHERPATLLRAEIEKLGEMCCERLGIKDTQDK